MRSSLNCLERDRAQSMMTGFFSRQDLRQDSGILDAQYNLACQAECSMTEWEWWYPNQPTRSRPVPASARHKYRLAIAPRSPLLRLASPGAAFLKCMHVYRERNVLCSSVLWNSMTLCDAVRRYALTLRSRTAVSPGTFWFMHLAHMVLHLEPPVGL